MNQTLKLSLFLQSNGNVEYDVSPSPSATYYSDGGHSVLEFDLDTKNVFLLSVNVLAIVPQSNLIIEKIMINDVQLHNLDSFGIYKTSHGVKRTYGFMDEVGSYKFKIRYNAILHNYLHFLLNK